MAREMAVGLPIGIGWAVTKVPDPPSVMVKRIRSLVRGS